MQTAVLGEFFSKKCCNPRYATTSWVQQPRDKFQYRITYVQFLKSAGLCSAVQTDSRMPDFKTVQTCKLRFVSRKIN